MIRTVRKRGGHYYLQKSGLPKSGIIVSVQCLHKPLGDKGFQEKG
jgi:hypothetical protein